MIGLDKPTKNPRKPQAITDIVQKPHRRIIDSNEVQTDFEKFLCEIDNSKLSKSNKNKEKKNDAPDQCLQEFDKFFEAICMDKKIAAKPGNKKNMTNKTITRTIDTNTVRRRS